MLRGTISPGVAAWARCGCSDRLSSSSTSASFTAALALWRGPAFNEFADEEFAQAEAARLDGLRATALEERGDAELALGHHASLVDDLQLSITSFPLRESFRRQLMLAL